MANLAVIGTGYVGLTTLVGMSQLGHICVGFDIDKEKLSQLSLGITGIYEPGLAEGLIEGLKSGLISFVHTIEDATKDAEFIFTCVSTPEAEDGSADISRVLAVADSVSKNLKHQAVFVTKSTVPVGTGEKIKAQIGQEDIFIASNPEFLREGTSLDDFRHPDRIVVGCDLSEVGNRVLQLYKDIDSPKILVSVRAAEMIKYASNSFLAVKLSFVNEIASLSTALGINAVEVLSAVGSDSRIGNKFMTPGPGWGGSCFPKDTLALLSTASGLDVKLLTLEAAVQSNGAIQSAIALNIYNIAVENKGLERIKIGFLGLAFKADTDDYRESPAMKIIEKLAKLNVEIVGFDYKAKPNKLENFTTVETISEAFENVDVLVVATEWEAFRDLEPNELLHEMKQKLVFDLRNILPRQKWLNAGARLFTLGVR